MTEKNDLSNLINQILEKDKNKDKFSNEQIKDLKISAIIPQGKSQSIDNFSKEIAKLKLNLKDLNSFSKDNKNLSKKSISFEQIISAISYGAHYFTLASQIRSLVNSIQELNDTEKILLKALALLSETGFSPNIDGDIEFLKSVNECENIENTRNQRKAITELALRHYNSERLYDIFNTWEERLLIRKRTKILKSAIDAHIHKKYDLSIPVLLAQIEGIVMDGFYHVGDSGHERLKLYLEDLITTQKNQNYNFGKNIFRNLFKNVMMVTFKKGIKEYSKSRHSILHGASFRYGKEDYSLKLILFLNMLIRMFNYCSYGSDEKYHVVGCKHLNGRVLRTSKKHPFPNFYYSQKNECYIEKLITFYDSENEAIAAGKIPCAKCIKS